MAPLFMGQLPMPLQNDYILPMVALAWYTTTYCGGARFWANNRIANSVLLVFVGLFRTHSVIRFTIKAADVFQPNKYEHCALMGPIFIGTLLASTGLFFPQRGDGFASIEGETPWAMQSAFIVSTFTHVMLHDKTGPIGTALRSLVGTWTKADIVMGAATMHLITIFAMTFINSDSTLFDQVHNVLYLITGVQRPMKRAVKKEYSYDFTMQVERFINRAKVLLCIIGTLFILTQNVAPAKLPVGVSITPSDMGLASCSWMSDYRSCTPYTLAFRETTGNPNSGYYQFSVRNEDTGDISWYRKITLYKGSDGSMPELRATVDAYGTLRITSNHIADMQEKEVYASSAKCEPPKNANGSVKENSLQKADSVFTTLHIDGITGKPVVVCGDRTVLLL